MVDLESFTPESPRWLMYAGMGQIDGFSIVEKFGHNSDIDIGSAPADVWLAGSNFPGQPIADSEKVELVSDSSDDAAAGTGARTVTIMGLDDDWAEQSETVTLDGTTPVDSDGTYRRVFRAFVATAGSGATNAGRIITRHTTTTANVFCHIPAGLAQTGLAAYTIPADKTGYLLGYHFQLTRSNGAAGSAMVTLRTREQGGVYRARDILELTTGANFDKQLYGPISLPAKTDIKVTVDSVSDNNSKVGAQFTILLEDD